MRTAGKEFSLFRKAFTLRREWARNVFQSVRGKKGNVLEIKRKKEKWSRGIEIALFASITIHPDKIWRVFTSSEPSRRRIGEDFMGGSLPGIPFPPP
jgi:hypothetical protein